MRSPGLEPERRWQSTATTIASERGTLHAETDTPSLHKPMRSELLPEVALIDIVASSYHPPCPAAEARGSTEPRWRAPGGDCKATS